MKKYLIVLFALVCTLVLAVSVSAAEHTVTTNSEYEYIYDHAESGDTIIIASKLSCNIQATKSITYILKADWESAKLVLNQSNVEVSFIADGGDYKIMPTNVSTNDGWMNISQEYEGIVINLGGKNGGSVTIDGTNVTNDKVCALTVNTADITWNFFNGSALANFNPQVADTSENAFIIYARTINMYNGSKVYANCVIGSPLMRATYFNLYGGEIFGNVLQSTRAYSKSAGAIFVSERMMIFGGKIYKNIFNAKGASQVNMLGFVTTTANKDVVVLDLEIGDTFVTGTSANDISAMFGTITNQFNNAKYYYSTSMQKGTRYTFTGTPALAYDAQTGKTIWQVSSFTVQSENWTGRGWTRTDTPGDKMAAFLKAEKKTIADKKFDTYTIINAYLEGIYAYSGSTTVAVPTGYELWSTLAGGYCHDGKAYTLDEVKASMPIILYTAYDAGTTIVNGVRVCAGECGKAYTCNNPEHDLVTVSITYNSFAENGVKEIKCNTCGFEDTTLVAVQPLFVCLGYSVPADGRSELAIGFVINSEAIREYEQALDVTVEYGAFAAAKDKIGSNPIFGENGEIASNVICAEISGYTFTSFELKIVGFAEDQKDLKLAMGAYVAVLNEEGTEYSYLQGGTPNENDRYYFTSYNEAVSF